MAEQPQDDLASLSGRAKTRGRIAAGFGVALLVAGAALAYAALARPWGHYAGTPFSAAELARLIPADRAALTVWWWDATNNLCGLLAALPVAVAAWRGRAIDRRWGAFSVMCAIFGALTALVAMSAFVEFSHFNDSGWVYAVDGGTLLLALGGYALLLAGTITLTRAARAGTVSPLAAH